MGYWSARKLPFWVEEHGDGAPPLLVVHGTGANAACFERAAPLLGRGRRVLVYDRRGFGRTGGPPHAHRDYFREHALDAAALLDAAGSSPATVLGWSAGAIVALHLALERPELVGRLVLFEPSLHVARQRPSARLALDMTRL